MRAKAHNRNHRAEDGRAESTYPEVAALLAQADLPAAGRLQELAASADRDLAKAARRALYTLRQAGIEPPDGAAPPPGPALLDADTQPAGARRAVMTTADHRADIVLTFVYEEPHGGRPTAATFVGGDTEGVVEAAAGRVTRRELESFLSGLRRGEDVEVAEVPVEFARLRLGRFLARSAAAGRALPEGTTQALRYVGPLEGADRPHAVYDHLDADAVRADVGFGHDPAALFEAPVFRLWVVPRERVEPWHARFVEALRTRLVLAPSQQAQVGDRVVAAAADELLGSGELAAYRAALEDSALVLFLAGREAESRAALYHALAIPPDAPPHAVPFARALVRRSMAALAAIDAEAEKKAEEEKRDSLIYIP